MMRNALIDTHAHLYLEEFRADLEAVISRAEAAGVGRIFLPSIDSHHVESMLELESSFPGRFFAMIGLHPCYVKDNFRDELKIMEEWLARRPFAAIGEIGLDYYWSREFDENQKMAFRHQIGLARDHKLPLVIHSRNSMDDCIEMVRTEGRGDLKGIFHCFSGTLENAHDIIGCGLLLGIGGVVTYKNAGLDKVVAELPLESLVLETDAPYLTPVPFRGKRNESSYLEYIVKRIAALKQVSEEEVARITTVNAMQVFGQ